MSALDTALDSAIAAVPVVAVIRHDDADIAERIARAAVDGGIRIVEVTFTVPRADDLIARLVGDLADVVVGAGTVLTTDQADAASSAGAGFLVSPLTDAAVLERAAARDVSVIPGAFTPTEVAAAARLGAHAVKVFPAAALGTGFVASLAEVLPHVKLMPTGGIAPEKTGEWITAGATAVGIAGALTTAWRRGGADAVTDAARTAIAAATSTATTKRSAA